MYVYYMVYAYAYKHIQCIIVSLPHTYHMYVNHAVGVYANKHT